MKRSCAAALFSALLLLTACNGATSTAPPALPNISGDYIGSFQDAQLGSGNVTGTLAQTTGAAGGAMSMPIPGGTAGFQMSLTVSPNNSVSGAIVIVTNGNTLCTASTTGTYDPTNNILSGTYTAVSGCTGDNGTYSLTQQCYNQITSSRRRTLGVRKC